MKLPIKEYLGLLRKYLKNYKLNMFLLTIVLILNVGIQLANPQILGYFIDAVKKGYSSKTLLIAALLFIGFAIIRQVLIIISTYLSENVGWKATNALRLDLIKHCINLDMAFHKKHQTGELVERVDGDVNALFKFFSTFVVDLLTNLALVVGIVVIILKEDFRVGLILAAFIILSMIIMGRIQKVAVKNWSYERECNANIYGFLGEQVTSVEDVNTCGAKGYVMNNLYKFFRKLLPIRVRADMGYYHLWMANLMILSIANINILLLCSYLYGNSIMTLGTVYVVFYYAELIANPLEEIKYQMQDLQRAEASIKRIKELMNIKSDMVKGTESLNVKESFSLSLDNVSFQYEDGEMVIKDISLELPKNKILGVLGHTGSGKTTLARLIVRLYDSTSGDIKLDGKNIKDILNEDLIKNISYVTQEVQIFHATVRDNLTLFNPNINDEKILEVIHDMELQSWFDKLPKGLDTMLDNGGTGLSAGEAQLLAFIRVFLKNPNLVILDEATSRLDPITEGLIENALNKLLYNRTGIIIAHRLWTVQRANNILILENGSMVEYGVREELEKDENSKFYTLLQKGIEEVLV